MIRDHFVYVPCGQREMTLQCKVFSHWLGAYMKWPLMIRWEATPTEHFATEWSRTRGPRHCWCTFYMIIKKTGNLIKFWHRYHLERRKIIDAKLLFLIIPSFKRASQQGVKLTMTPIINPILQKISWTHSPLGDVGVMFKMLWTKFVSTSCKVALRWMSQNTFMRC